MHRKHRRSKKADGISKMYYNPKHPGDFCGVSGFLKNNKNVNKARFKEWSEKQNAITQHCCARKRFPRCRVLVFSTGDLFQVDLMDFQSLASSNSGYRIVLVAIDVFSKFAWAVTLKRKTTEEVLRGLQIIVKDMSPRKIEMYATYNYDMKACVVERFIRTFKSRLYRYFTQNSTDTYIRVLPDIIQSYNHSFHRSIKMTPVEARKPRKELLV